MCAEECTMAMVVAGDEAVMAACTAAVQTNVIAVMV